MTDGRVVARTTGTQKNGEPTNYLDLFSPKGKHLGEYALPEDASAQQVRISADDRYVYVDLASGGLLCVPIARIAASGK